MDISLAEILRVLPNPTLITIDGERSPPLFLSTLLHGNETASFEVLQALARRYADSRPPRKLLIFVGNVEAAASAVRLLPGQPDFNRIWAGGDSMFVALADHVKQVARVAAPFASIDIHNNTGLNPHYGCINVLRPSDLQLAAWFAPIAVYYRNPPTTQSMAFAEICPAITLECGRSGEASGVIEALRLIDRVMTAETIAIDPSLASTLRLYETVGRVLIDPACSFSFGEAQTELVLRADLEHLNFRDVSAGEQLGTCSYPAIPLTVVDEQDRNLTAQFFAQRDGSIVLTRSVTPAMLTRDHAVIRQDCLGYLMIRRSIPR